jgi:hypothetical protein
MFKPIGSGFGYGDGSGSGYEDGYNTPKMNIKRRR